MSVLGDNIKVYRVKAKLTQEELAEKLGVTRQAVAAWESGKSVPAKKRLQKVSQILNVTSQRLTEEDNGEQDYLPEGALPMSDEIIVPVVSEEMSACLGYGIQSLDITSESQVLLLADRSQFHVLDNSRMPYGLVCHGECLESIGLRDGFAVVVNPAEMPANGNLALVSMNDMLSVKFFARRGNGDVILSSDNGTVRLTPEEQEEADFSVEGAIVSWQPLRRPIKIL